MKKALKPLFDLAKKVQKNLNSDETADQEFLEKVKEQIEDFKKSRQRVLHLEPMNSYERRLVHNLAPEYGLQSYSEGDDDERHLVLSKDKDKKAAEGEKAEERPKRRAKLEPAEEEKPARGARRENGSYNSRSRKTEDSGETDNEEFLEALKQEVAKFQKSKEKAHHLEPMNSYQRMLVHTLAKELELFSASEGDDDERHIVLYKEEPPKSAARPPVEKRDREEKRERKPFPRREGRSEEDRDRGERSDRGGERDFRPRRPRDDRNAVAEGDREFFVPIQEGGVEIVLDDTGFVGLEGANPSAQILDRKHIKLGSFKVRDGKIVTIEDKEW